MKSAMGLSAILIAAFTMSTVSGQEGVPQAAAPSQPESQPALETARLELQPAIFDFGEVWQGALARTEFRVKNTGTAPLTLNLVSSCGCTVATKPKSPLAPGEGDTFTITYDTKRIGPAGKKVTVNSNDPTQPAVVIDVRGTVKPIFAATPADCSFKNVDADTVATQTIKLENQYPKALPLRIKAGQNIEKFRCELKEVEAGKAYELTVTTQPPLNEGKNIANLALETGMPDLPDIELRLSADFQPRASLSPMAVYVTPAKTKSWDTMLTVQYRADKPLQILSAHSDLESITCEVLPAGPTPEGAVVCYRQIRVKLPAFDEVPVAGAKIIIETDDPDPKFAKMEAPVTRREGRRRTHAVPVPSTQATPIEKPSAAPKADGGSEPQK